MSSDSNSSSSDSDDQNPGDIDQSLDAIENQLASISMSSRSPTTTLDDEMEIEVEDDEEGEQEEEQPVDRLKLTNGSLDERFGAEGAIDSLKEEYVESNLKAETSGVTKEIEVEEEEEREEAQPLDQLTLTNGSLNVTLGAEGAIDSLVDEHVESNLKAETSGVIKEIEAEEEEREETQPLDHLPITNGSLDEKLGPHVDEHVESNLKAEMLMEIEESSSGVWRNTLEVDEAEPPLTPSSSGYAGERGSTSGDDDDDEEIREVDNDGVLGNHEPWVSGKRHPNEDDASVSWRKRKKHFFMLSNSGKPIYSRYGDEHKLAGFSATLQAIISFVENGGDRVKLVRAGKHQVVFLVKGPIYLVCISCTEEPYESLKGQLELFYGQMIVILTKSVNRCFEKNPKFDMTSLLGGTDAVFSSLIHSFSWNPATFLHAYSCLPLAYATRQAAGAILQDTADSGILFALLMCKHKVISLVGAQKASLHPDDILLLSNFVMSSESFRTSESFSPICLPRYNAMAFLYAYVHYFDVDTYLILLTTSSDAFYHLKDSRIRIEAVLLKSNVLSEVQRSLLDGGMHIQDLPVDPTSRAGAVSSHLGQPRPVADSPGRNRDTFTEIGGPAGLWHFIYRSINLDQYVSSEYSSPINTWKQQKRLYRAYQRLYASMHDQESGPHKTQFRRDENYVLLCWVTQDFELYAAFDPLADKAFAIKTCNRVCHWVKEIENDIFLLGASPFSW